MRDKGRDKRWRCVRPKSEGRSAVEGMGLGRKKREGTRQGQRLCETGSVLDPRGGLQNDRPQHSAEWEVRRCDGPVSLPARGVGAVGVVVECGGGVVWCCGPDLAVYVVRGQAGSRSDAVEREYELPRSMGNGETKDEVEDRENAVGTERECRWSRWSQSESHGQSDRDRNVREPEIRGAKEAARYEDT